MEEFLQSIDLANQWQYWLKAIGIWLLLGVPPALLVASVVYLVIAPPLWRRDRARLFLDLLETGLNSGQTAEATLAGATAAPDRALGRHLRRLGPLLRQGLRLDLALMEVPALLPAQVNAMLKTGAELGDPRRVLPACRRLLDDQLSRASGALNHVFVALTVASPWAVGVIAMLAVVVLPKMKEVFFDMEIPRASLFTFLSEYFGWIILVLQLVFVLFYLGVAIFLAGPRLSRWIPFLHQLHFRLPWRRRRMQRDFTAMLALLLDAGLPEARAVELAGDCTANDCFRRRVARAVADLRVGIALAESLRRLDDSGEFHWRLANAQHAEHGFTRALAGWEEALDARAFQHEQAAAHVITTGAVLLQGVLVGLVAISVFAGLIGIIEEGVLW